MSNDSNGLRPLATNDDDSGDSADVVPATTPKTADQLRVRKRRRRETSVRSLLRHPAVLTGALVVFLFATWSGFQAYSALAAYRDISADARELKQYEQRDLATLSVTDLRSMQMYLDDIDANLRTLDRATYVPILTPVARNLPWIGPRYAAGRDLVKTSQLLATAGHDGAKIGADTLAAYDATGFSRATTAPGSTTWLDVLSSATGDVSQIADDIARAREARADIDIDVLPARVRAKVNDLDRALNRFDYESLANETLPAAVAALGADGPVSYWVLFPNPAELRPVGGFPGTGALVTFEHGQIVSYEFFDMKAVSDEYIAERPEVVPAPVPIDTYLYDGGYLPHDTSWWADFPRVSEDFMRLYEAIDWPPIEGVIAVQPSAVADLLKVTGSLTVDVDGEPREITAENVFIEMERQRARRRTGEVVGTNHKDVIANVGVEIMNRLKAGNRSEIRLTAELMRAAAGRRDIQLYSTNESVMRVLDEQRWSGRITPDPETPTLAVTFANMVATKASLTMFPAVTIQPGASDDAARVLTLNIALRHEGTDDADPYYSGFQRWWVQVDLPDGAELISRDNEPQDDPDAPDGGAYLIEIFPQQTGDISLTFRVPLVDTLLFRRQPGVNPVMLSLVGEECASSEPVPVSSDVVLNVAERCP